MSGAEPPELPALSILLRAKSPTKLVSLLYSSAQASTLTKYSKARLAWQTDLGFPLTDDIWTYCCVQTQKISLNGRHRLTHFKFLNRVHHTPSRLFRYGLRDTDSCERCSAPGADFMHLAWGCPPVQDFWSQVFSTLSAITGLPLEPSPLLALLGYTKPIVKDARNLIAMGLLLARRRVAMRWMRGRAPTTAEWHRDMTYCHTQSDTYNELLPPTSRPKTFWSLYTQYTLAHQARGGDSD